MNHAPDPKSEQSTVDPAEQRERDLLRGVAQERMQDFDALFMEYHDRLFRFVSRVSGSPDLVDEVTNDTMLAVWKQAGKFEFRSKVSTWIFGIAYRISLKALRKRGRRQRLSEANLSDESELTQGDALDEHDLKEMVEFALNALSPQQRAIVELTFYMGYSYEEISRTLDCPVGTVKSRMFLARKKLKPILERMSDAKP